MKKERWWSSRKLLVSRKLAPTPTEKILDSGKPFYQTPVISSSPYVPRFKSTKYLAHISGISTRPGTPLKQKQNNNFAECVNVVV